MRTFAAAIALSAAVIASPAMAAVQGTTTATFSDAKPTTAVYTGMGTNAITWGTATSGSQVNRLTFGANTPFSATLGQQFKIGSISYYNGTIENGTELTSVGLNLAFNFADPAIGAFTKSFTLGLTSTPNTGTADQNADFVTFPSFNTTDTFTVNGQAYQFKLLGLTNVVGDGFLSSNASQFNVREGGNASADVFGILSAVPEPTTWAMMLVGFGMVGASARYRRRSVKAAITA
ncbi:hypothetical protein GGQ80_001639 [Sphingomonas jinjuensis]|uniref:Ice-binding protein C-terminal domain-containing protein n=1 Tax=Sphingomonas jinjuensis TaxID=535907 RepID=A0A840F313_9SPHN|nr:choice-of-anchor K domain-containing protein [Sphingomonas jinjuensis]MBB4153733.1 hypothetical protein [Sphingomonas jinjuensis]